MMPLRLSARYFSSRIMDVLITRGLSKDSAAIVSQVLKTTTKQVEEQINLAKTLPLSALSELEKTNKIPTEVEFDSEVKIRVLNEGGREYIVKGKHGESLQDLVARGTILSEYLECACGGNMMCSTCHVYVRSPKDLGKNPSDEEQDMLDIAFNPIEGVSRLGCQLKLQKGVELIVEIPTMFFNHFK